MAYTVRLEEDPNTGDLLLPFPPEMLESLGWDEGDTLIWEELDNGNWRIVKKEES